MFLIVILFIGIFVLGFVCTIYGNDTDEQLECEAMQKFTNKIDKLLKRVTDEEKCLYSKIWKKVYYGNVKNWKTYTFEDDQIFAIELSNIQIRFKRQQAGGWWMSNEQLYVPIQEHYECRCIFVFEDVKNTESYIKLAPNAERKNIYDLIAECAVWKIEQYRKYCKCEENKKISDDYQQNIKKANQLIK